MRNQRKRNSVSHDAVGEAMNNLKSLLATITEAEPPATPPPDGISDRRLSGVGKLGTGELEELQLKIDNAHGYCIEAQHQWESLEAQVRMALDATMRVVQLKAAGETDTKKRRRDSAAPANATGKPGLSIGLGSSVAYRLPKSADDEWIVCEVTKVLQDGQRYEIRDPEPDEQGNSGKLFRAAIKDLILLPKPGQNTNVFAPGDLVLAQYPETTAFYKAMVTNLVGSGPKKYRLVFDGEEEADKETEIAAHLVIPRK